MNTPFISFFGCLAAILLQKNPIIGSISIFKVFSVSAGHSLTTFELTITRLASKVRKIVKDKIHDEEDDSDEEDGDSEEEEEEDSSDEKWKLR